MANEIQTKFDAFVAITISLSPGGAGLATGIARSSLLIGNPNRRPAALINLRVSPNTAPTAGTTYDLFLLRTNGTAAQGTDLWAETDAVFVPVNAQLIGSLVNPGTTTDVEDLFDTAPLGPLGGDWGIAVRNSTNVSIDNTEGNHIKEQALYLPEIQ